MSENTASEVITDKDYSDEQLGDQTSQELVNTSTGELVPAVIKQTAVTLNQAGGAIFKTFESKPGEEFEDSLKVFGAINNAEPLSEHLNKKIELVDIVAMDVIVTDRVTGVPVQLTRVILIDKDGKAYAAISNGLYRSVQNILGVFPPVHTWPKPVGIKVVAKQAAKGKFFTVQLAL